MNNFIKSGCDVSELSDAELLALLIHPQSIKKAIELLEMFGNFRGILTAEMVELTAVLSEKNACRLKAGLEIALRLAKPNLSKRVKITSPKEVADLVRVEMSLLDHEQLWVVILNQRNEVLTIDKIYKGGINTIYVRVGELFNKAVKLKAAGMIVVHNHPSGDYSPSPEDIAVTKQLVEAGKLLNISVEDHLIIANNQFCSLRERGLGFH